MKNVYLLLVAIAIVVGLNACKSSKTAVADGSAADITGKYWRLIEIQGKPVENTEGREPHILFNTDNTFVGSGGCNSLGGAFEVKEPFRITFSQGRSTLMACPDMEVEDAFLKIIGEVDNYTVSEDGKTLSLNKARMAPLARFELDDSK